MLYKTIITDIRIFYRILKETLKGIKSTGWMNLAIIGTMAAILSIFSCMLRTSIGISSFVQNLGTVLEVSVYIKPTGDTQFIAKTINDFKYVKQVEIITKQQAWKKLKRDMDVPDISNPLPDTLHVKISEQKHIEGVISQIKQLKGIEGIKYAKELAVKMQKINDFSNIATIFVLFFVGGLTMFIINNTIYLVIQTRREEIEIMRMMGVTNWYIKSPYLLQGGFYGLVSALIALLPLNIIQDYLSKLDEFFQISVPVVYVNFVALTVIIIGVSLGIMGSFISIKKYLKV